MPCGAQRRLAAGSKPVEYTPKIWHCVVNLLLCMDVIVVIDSNINLGNLWNSLTAKKLNIVQYLLMCGFSKHLCPFKLNFLQTETWQHHLLLQWSHYDFTALHNFKKKYLIIRLPFIYVLKSVLSEITVRRTWVQVVFRQKNCLWFADLSWFFELISWLLSQKKLTLG